jgi:hypothetical protein
VTLPLGRFAQLFERYLKQWLVIDSGTIVFYDGAIVLLNLHMYSPRGRIHGGNGSKWYDETGIEYGT